MHCLRSYDTCKTKNNGAKIEHKNKIRCFETGKMKREKTISRMVVLVCPFFGFCFCFRAQFNAIYISMHTLSTNSVVALYILWDNTEIYIWIYLPLFCASCVFVYLRVRFELPQKGIINVFSMVNKVVAMWFIFILSRNLSEEGFLLDRIHFVKTKSNKFLFIAIFISPALECWIFWKL